MAPLKENYSEVLQTPGRAKRSILLAVDTVPGQSILLLRWHVIPGPIFYQGMSIIKFISDNVSYFYASFFSSWRSVSSHKL